MLEIFLTSKILRQTLGLGLFSLMVNPSLDIHKTVLERAYEFVLPKRDNVVVNQAKLSKANRNQAKLAES